MDEDLKILKVEMLNLSLDDQTISYKYLKWRRPQNTKNGISQQPLIGSCSNFKLKLRWTNHILQMNTTSNGRRAQT